MSPKTALITGASQGIGKAVALKLAAMNYQVALLARSQTKLTQVANEINATYPEANPLVFSADVSDANAISQAVEQLMQKTSRIDVLFNNAGIVIGGDSSISIADFNKQVQVNVFGAFHCLHYVVPIMKQQKSGYIFNVSSRSGKMLVPRPLFGYGATKFAVRGMSEYLFHELAAYGINVTALYPGLVATAMTDNVNVAKEEMIPPADIAATVEYLLKLSPNTVINEVFINCRRAIISRL